MRTLGRIALCAWGVSVLSGCAGTVQSSAPAPTYASNTGKYYQDDGPGATVPPNLDSIPDAVPRLEKPASGANKPYTVMNQSFVPLDPEAPYQAEGEASWYGRKYHGRKTSIGEVYDMYTMTAAHTTMSLPSYARVTNLENGKSVIVRVNDRGPFLQQRVIDLSYAAAYRLGYVQKGRARVRVERITPEQIRTGNFPAPANGEPEAQADASPVTAPGAATVKAANSKQGAALATADALGGLIAASIPAATATPSLRPTPSSNNGPVASAAHVVHTNDQAPEPWASLPNGTFLQLGAFTLLQSAQRLCDQINSELGELSQAARVIQTDALYKVFLGPYADRDAANLDEARVQNRAGFKPLLVIR